jgi:putative endonuclease
VVWWVYLIEGRDGQLYCGISTDPDRRLREHNASRRGSKWARAHRPLRLVWREFAGSKGAALRRERVIKAMGVAAKRRLAGLNDRGEK